MKKTKILYWVFTVPFAGFMLFSGIMNAIITPDSVVLLTDQLGYPQYIIPFLGVAKILGAIAILIPGFPRLKEWAYAGLFFDLIGATYSMIAIEGFKPEHLGMLMFFIPGVLSYIFYLKKLKGE
ncbi:MAG TPA: DoxX family protein [Chryseolinea sp.]|nr:DoxX family protein [Chryseolinea sp.]HPH45445.1 DoxX family protein [Chryseolinea sp.]HPM29367.1 DoxX family protein [Chryseolinea sp.]